MAANDADPRECRALRVAATHGTLVALITLILASCDALPDRLPAAVDRAAQPTPTPLANPTAAPTVSAVPTAVTHPPPDATRTRYSFSIRFDYASHHLSVEQIVTYVHASSQELHELVFVVESNRRSGVFNLTGLRWADGAPVAGYALEGALLRVPLPAPLAPGQAIALSLSYELNLPAQAAPLGYTSRQANLGDWYPFVPPYAADRGWLVHEPGAIGEHLVFDIADYEVEIYLAGAATEVVIAAGGEMSPTGDGRMRYRLDAARSFAWSASHAYQILHAQAGATTVMAYVLPEHRAAGEAALEAVANAVSIYSERFAPYPYATLSVVESEFPDGMEYHSLFFLGQEYFAGYAGDARGYLTAIAVHETAHQWWYGLVGNDQAIEPWLDEALATYSELLFYETTYPGLADWWWEFRVKRFNPAGWVDSTIYDHDGFRAYVDAVYLRGALFLEEVRRLIGDEDFFAFLRAYAGQGSLRQVTGDDFVGLLTMHTEADLRPLILEFFERLTPVEANVEATT